MPSACDGMPREGRMAGTRPSCVPKTFYPDGPNGPSGHLVVRHVLVDHRHEIELALILH